jgi:hypothetical protein
MRDLNPIEVTRQYSHFLDTFNWRLKVKSNASLLDGHYSQAMLQAPHINY